MDPATSSKVTSRFVTETDVKAAQERRAAEWAETYKRMGQEPPPMSEEQYDPRSLYERLKSNKDKKQEEFEEMIKFKNQFRALDEDEIGFLDSITEEQDTEEREREIQIQNELSSFRKAVAAKSLDDSKVNDVSSDKISTTILGTGSGAVIGGTSSLTGGGEKKKDSSAVPKKTTSFQKNFLKGAIVTKKRRKSGEKIILQNSTSQNKEKEKEKEKEDDVGEEGPMKKKAKVDLDSKELKLEKKKDVS